MGEAATVPWEAFDVTHPDHNEWAEQTGRCLASDCTEHQARKETHMPISEDGIPYGSIDVSKLDEVKPKTDEAKAQLEALKAERDAGQEQVARDAERLAELHQTQSGLPASDEEREQARAAQQKDAKRQQAEADKRAAASQPAQAEQAEDTTAKSRRQ